MERWTLFGRYLSVEPPMLRSLSHTEIFPLWFRRKSWRAMLRSENWSTKKKTHTHNGAYHTSSSQLSNANTSACIFIIHSSQASAIMLRLAVVQHIRAHTLLMGYLNVRRTQYILLWALSHSIHISVCDSRCHIFLFLFCLSVASFPIPRRKTLLALHSQSVRAKYAR